MVEAKIIQEELDVGEVLKDLAKYSENGMGAVVSFIGYVKGLVGDKKVYSLEYSSYEPYATKILENIASEEVKEEDVYDIRIYHRIGDLKPGDITLYIFVAAKDRKKAFKVCEKVLERVKHEPYIFKLEKREDGEYWVFRDGERFKREKKA